MLALVVFIALISTSFGWSLPTSSSEESQESTEYVLHLNSEQFRKQVLSKNSGISFVEFYWTGCPACEEFKPYWQNVGRDLKGVIDRVVSLNCYRNSDICNGRIDSYPQFSVFKDGKHIAIYDDGYSDNILVDFIKEKEYLEEEFRVRKDEKWY